MADEWNTLMRLEASWGGVKFHLRGTRDERHRAIAAYTFPHRDGADTEDMGAEARVTRARLVFFETPASPRPRDRLRQFEDLVESGKPYTFVHPGYGSYVARVADLTVIMDAEARGHYEVECSFVEHSTIRAILTAAAPTPEASLEEVKTKAAAVDEALVASTPRGQTVLTSAIGATSITAVQGWIDEPPAIQTLALEVAALQAQIQAEMERLEVATRIERWSLYNAMVNLSHAIRRYADGAVQASPRYIEIVVEAPVALIVLASKIYGAGEAFERYAQLLELNEIPNPLRLEAGTVLRAEEPRGQRALA